MLRLRHKDGRLAELPEGVRYVELCDDQGRIAALVFRADDGMIHVADPTDAIALQYAKQYGAEFTQLIQVTNKGTAHGISPRKH